MTIWKHISKYWPWGVALVFAGVVVSAAVNSWQRDINRTDECYIPETSRNSRDYRPEEAVCFVIQRTDATFEEARYVVELMDQQLEDLGLNDGTAEGEPYVDPYEYVLRRDTRNLGTHKITEIIDAEYYYNKFIGFIEE